MAECLTDKIVLTPTKKSKRSTTLLMERVRQQADESKVLHIAGGDHKGIVINKEANKGSQDDVGPPHLVLQFKVFLQDQSRSDVLLTQENRILRFWYVNTLAEREKMRNAHEFFKELVRPDDFPRDYVGFIKKIMKMMQLRYSEIRKIECEMTQLEELVAPPVTQREPKEDAALSEPVTEQRLLDLVEHAYPNAISLDDLKTAVVGSDDQCAELLLVLERRNLIKQTDHGGFMRVVQFDNEVKMVKQMPKVAQMDQPSIAIITALYPEKLAVDTMIDNTQTFVRYKTEGESNVYTLGDIGEHRVVSTKLPAVGHTRSAMIAGGNTTTRLLGTFQKIQYVFLVGVGGGVPHYTDHKKHVRLGDVVVSSPEGPNTPMYIYCDEKRENKDTGNVEWDTKTWCPSDLIIQTIAQSLIDKHAATPEEAPWLVNGDAALLPIVRPDTFLEASGAMMMIDDDDDNIKGAMRSGMLYALDRCCAVLAITPADVTRWNQST
ncbi:PREDICTED: uncharacterized protein LOC106816671 [Priapulus caudatus]|uniref:Uncharacterized protein LOC106816671 n=1 Tax=Priapulus caudatus TaxID=37621 RepID=A0ABM1EX58_PRICU|nr:PREDICTED: uncharacterized protein LOC106816671 [Priapulus caudatus]